MNVFYIYIHYPLFKRHFAFTGGRTQDDVRVARERINNLTVFIYLEPFFPLLNPLSSLNTDL